MQGCSWKSSSPNSRQMIAFPTTATGDNIAIAVAFEKITTERNLSLSFQLWSSELYICSHEGLTLEMLDLQTLYGGNLHYRLSW